MPLALGVVAVGSGITAGQRIALAHRLMRELDQRRARGGSACRLTSPSRGRGFTIVDRRGSQSEPAATSAARARATLPPADFAAIVLSFASSALFHLGLVARPGDRASRARRAFRSRSHSIDLLELLQAEDARQPERRRGASCSRTC